MTNKEIGRIFIQVQLSVPVLESDAEVIRENNATIQDVLDMGKEEIADMFGRESGFETIDISLKYEGAAIDE